MKPKPRDNANHQRRLAAVHLAARAVTWLVSGRSMDYAHGDLSLAPQNAQTPVDLSYAFAFYSPQQARALVVSILAGFLAEKELDPNAPRSNATADKRLARRLVRKFTLPEIKELEVEASDLVARFGDIIRAFAAELLEREAMNGDQCQQLFEQLCKSVMTN